MPSVVVTRMKAVRRPGGSLGSQLTWKASTDLMVVEVGTPKILVANEMLK
jgi:hypothetical protein